MAGVLAEADWPARSALSAGWSPPPPAERVAVVVGIGVNVNWPAELPVDLAEIAASLNHLAGGDVDREALLVTFLRRLDERYGALVSPGEDGRRRLVAEWRARSATIGRQVRIDLGADDVVGTAVDVDGAGRLVVESLDGERRTFAGGDVVHLRPA